MGKQYLIDTHVLLWWVFDDAKLCAVSRSIIANPINDILVSSATAWEIATKYRIGKLPEAKYLLENYASVLNTLGFIELPINTNHALTAGSLTIDHRDPFDRMLMAQAQLEQLPIITYDPAFYLLDIQVKFFNNAKHWNTINVGLAPLFVTFFKPTRKPYMRTHKCGELSTQHTTQTVSICGWVHRRRDHGGVIFIDLRDRAGLAQVVVDPDYVEAFAIAEHVRSEYVLRITGVVRDRPAGTVNANMHSGAIEILAKEIEVLNESETPPFPVESDIEVNEELRLKYRYIDLRRVAMQEKMKVRRDVTRVLRNFLDDNEFFEIETPYLTKATPEGARDYIVPSRTHENSFFALPQSPQLYKQMLMVAGMDRYYQVVRCFRDEDLRADRQPEFTQLDIETSFMTEDQIMNVMEEMIRQLFAKVINVELDAKFPRMTHAEAISRYGIDRPDLRIPLELVDIGEDMRLVDFKVFSTPAKDPQGRVVAMRVPNAGDLSRKDIEDLTKYVSIYGAKGLAYIKVNDLDAGIDGLQSPIVKFAPAEVWASVLAKTGAQNGDLIFFGADKASIVNEAMGALRVKLGHDLNLLQGEWKPVWVVDFPMFDWDEKAGRFNAIHHPFTAPSCSVEELVANPAAALSRAYDLVLNGTEVGGGSIRINRPAMQQTVFELLGIGDEEAREKFGFLLDALKYGAPPHGGLAFGLDRLVMLMTGSSSIRDVIAFPKTQSAACPLVNAPAVVTDEQLKELGIRLIKPVGKGKE